MTCLFEVVDDEPETLPWTSPVRDMYELVPVYFWSILEPELARFWRWYWLARFKADVMVAPEKGREGEGVEGEK